MSFSVVPGLDLDAYSIVDDDGHLVAAAVDREHADALAEHYDDLQRRSPDWRPVSVPPA